MKKQAKRMISLTLTLIMLLSVCAVVSVSAEENNTVRVVVKNEMFSADSGAPWTGVLIDTNATLLENDSVESVLERVIRENNYEFTVSNYGYISSVNGLAEYAASGSGEQPMVVSYLLSANKVLETPENGVLSISSIVQDKDEQNNDCWKITVTTTLNAADQAEAERLNSVLCDASQALMA